MLLPYECIVTYYVENYASAYGIQLAVQAPCLASRWERQLASHQPSQESAQTMGDGFPSENEIMTRNRIIELVAHISNLQHQQTAETVTHLDFGYIKIHRKHASPGEDLMPKLPLQSFQVSTVYSFSVTCMHEAALDLGFRWSIHSSSSHKDAYLTTESNY